MHRHLTAVRFATPLLMAMSAVIMLGGHGFAQSAAANRENAETSNDAAHAAFRNRDNDGDGVLTVEEFVAGGGKGITVLQRDFLVFDADGDGRLSLREFLTVPGLFPEEQQAPISDPVTLLSEKSLSNLTMHWKEWDGDGDGFLDLKEFTAAAIGSKVRGLETTEFGDWDLNGDRLVSLEVVAKLLDIAFGVCVPTGESLRLKGGRVVHWLMFLDLKPDGNGKLRREDYIKFISGAPQKPEFFFPTINDVGNETFGFAQFATTIHRTDPVSSFLGLDADLNGRLTPSELEPLPGDWRKMAQKSLRGFDDNGDGALSLREYQLLPHNNLLAHWENANDANNDGKLSQEEFRFMPGLSLRALAAEYFGRLDLDKDQSLSLNEWPFSTAHPAAKFALLDVNSDGELTEAEFIVEGSMPADRLRRDFKVFDADGNGRLSLTEFLTISYWVPEDKLKAIPDAVVLLSERSLSELDKSWSEWDADNNGDLSQTEFKTAALGRRIRGLEMTGFPDWDLNQDQRVSREEAGRFLDIAYGVRVPTGESLRLKGGRVVHWLMFLDMQPDRNGRVKRDAYLKFVSGAPQKPEFFFPTINDAGNETFGFAAFATSIHRTDPVASFLQLDVDLDARLTLPELDAIPIDWRKMARMALAGFDDDGDGAFSIREYQLLPHNNLLAHWENGNDANNDGKLSQEEFRFMPKPALAALTSEYFRRLDTDGDGFLGAKEWIFVINSAKVPRRVVLEQRDRDGDGKLTFDEVLGDIRLPQPGEREDVGKEAMLLRIEEAFRRADKNDDSALDLQELASDDGLEAVAPGASQFSKKTTINSAAPVTRFLGMDDANVEMFAIVELNILLAIGVGIYLYRKWERQK